jgi:uncharacterized membrane protein YozB (DUF420 family)
VSVADLPLVNATLNGIAGTLLLFGYMNIRRGRIQVHRRFMLSAFTTSILFLISYVVYHANAGSRPFPGQGGMRAIYFFILITHVVLAATVPVLAIITLNYGLRSRFDRHVRIARWTFPIWMYVSVTGVVVYLMLYRMY